MVHYNAITDITFLEDPTAIIEPVLLTEAKDFCRIDIGTDDTLITALITTARLMCEAYTAVSMVDHEIEIVCNNASGGIYLPYGPIKGVTSVTNRDGDALVLDSTYTLEGTMYIRLMTPHEDGLTVAYTTGYSTLPEVFKTAILNAVYYLYDNRAQGTDDIGPIAKMLLNPYRRV